MGVFVVMFFDSTNLWFDITYEYIKHLKQEVEIILFEIVASEDLQYNSNGKAFQLKQLTKFNMKYYINKNIINSIPEEGSI